MMFKVFCSMMFAPANRFVDFILYKLCAWFGWTCIKVHVCNTVIRNAGRNLFYELLLFLPDGLHWHD